LIAALIRHGDYHQLTDVPSAHQPFALNEKGEGEAEQAARLLAGAINRSGWELLPCIDSSRMLRAWQTADVIAHQLAPRLPAIPTIEDFDELAERGVGSAANLSIRQIEDVLHRDPRFTDPPPNWKANSHYRLPLQGAESLLEAGERVAAHLTKRMHALATAGRDQNTLKLFVGHGAAFRHAAYHLGLLEFEQIAKLSMYHGRPVFLEYDLDGHWLQVGGEWKIRSRESHFLD